MRNVYRVLLIVIFAASVSTLRSQDLTKPFSVEQLKSAINNAMADKTMDRETKDKVVEGIIKFWQDNRMIARAAYEENLRYAINLWYANDRDWHKIPIESWDSLSAADQGRLKLGIDPEMQCLAPATAKSTPQSAKSKK